MITAIHRTEPNWPPDPKRPVYQAKLAVDRVRLDPLSPEITEVYDRDIWVETDGDAPTDAEIAAVLSPPELAQRPAIEDRIAALESIIVAKGLVKQSELDAEISAAMQRAHKK